MAQQDGGGGFQQAAGLIRYFDEEEESSINIDPRFVVGGAILTGIVVSSLNFFYPVT